MKRILFVIPSLGCGGAEQILLRWIGHYWKNRRVDPRVDPVLVFSMNEEGPYLDDLPPGLQTFNLRQNPFTRNPLDVLRAAWALARIYRRLQPDLVVSIVSHANILALLAARLFRPKTKVIICEQTLLNTNIRDFYPRAHVLLNPLIRRLYPSAHRIVAVSEGVRADLLENFGLRPESIQVILNPIDIALVRQKAREFVPDFVPGPEPLVLGIGRLVNQKGFVYLLRAIALVRRELPATLLLIGDGPLRSRLEEEVQELGLGEAVRFLGFQKNPIRYMPLASVFVFTSIYEALGIVLLEALAAGIPIVATCCPCGPGEILQDEINGLLVPIRDEQALAQAILRLLRDPQLRHSLSEAGRRRIEEYFSVAEHMSRYSRIFTEAMASGGSVS